MFNIGFSEMILIGVIALIFIGPKQLPELARTLGKLLSEFKKATADITGTVTGFKESARSYMDETRNDVQSQLFDPHHPTIHDPHMTDQDPHQLTLNLDQEPESAHTDAPRGEPSSAPAQDPIKKDESKKS